MIGLLLQGYFRFRQAYHPSPSTPRAQIVKVDGSGMTRADGSGTVNGVHVPLANPASSEKITCRAFPRTIAASYTNQKQETRFDPEERSFCSFPQGGLSRPGCFSRV